MGILDVSELEVDYETTRFIETDTMPPDSKQVGERQEEGDGASEREDGTSGVWALQRSFFMPRPSRMDLSSSQC